MKHIDNKQIVVNIETRTVTRIIGISVVAVLALLFIRNIIQPLTLIFISFFLAMALNPAVSKIANKLPSKSRVKATGAAYILVVLFLAAFLALVVPPLFKQTTDFIQEVPATIQNSKNNNASINEFVDRYNLHEQVNRFTSDFSGRFGDVGKPVLSTAGAIGSAVANSIIVLVLTFMMLVEGHVWLNRFWAIQAPSKRKRRQEIAYRMYKVVVNYVNGQMLIAALGGFFASIAIFIFSQIFDAYVNPIALGGIIALFALLPMIGTILGSVIVVLACLLVSVPLAIAVAIYFLVYQQIENVTIQPYIQARGNNLTPLTVFIAAILGVGVGGLLGALVAIPAAGCIQILIQEYYATRLKNAPKELTEEA